MSRPLDDAKWTQTFTRSNFNAAKRKLLWTQDGSEQGIEPDEIRAESRQTTMNHLSAHQSTR
jgi:hypothetical protein